VPTNGNHKHEHELKEKILNTITTHPKIAIFGIGLAITFVIGTAIGMVDHSQAHALGLAAFDAEARSCCR
jgi:hypothetical protein